MAWEKVSKFVTLLVFVVHESDEMYMEMFKIHTFAPMKMFPS